MSVVRIASVIVLVLFVFTFRGAARKCSISLKPWRVYEDQRCTAHCNRKYGEVEIAIKHFVPVTRGKCILSVCWCLVNKLVKLSRAERIKLMGSTAGGFKKWYLKKVTKRREDALKQVTHSPRRSQSTRSSVSDEDGRVAQQAEVEEATRAVTYVKGSQENATKEKETQKEDTKEEDSKESTTSSASSSSLASDLSRVPSTAGSYQSKAATSQSGHKKSLAPSPSPPKNQRQNQEDTLSQTSDATHRTLPVLGEVDKGTKCCFSINDIKNMSGDPRISVVLSS
nr:PREDICTED: uncharacterized protein LOC109042556 [Bemisia tabaci]